MSGTTSTRTPRSLQARLLMTVLALVVVAWAAAAALAWQETDDEVSDLLDAHLAPLRERLHQGGAALSEDLMAGGPTAGRALLRRFHALDAEIRAAVSAYQATRRPRPGRALAGPPADGG